MATQSSSFYLFKVLLSTGNIKASKNVIVPADKSHLMYQIPIPVYRKLLSNAVTDTYKISSQKKVATVNKDTLYLLEKCEPGLESRVEVFTQAEAVVTIKDQKSSFPSQIEVRLIKGPIIIVVDLIASY